jgi:hypothetical protein
MPACVSLLQRDVAGGVDFCRRKVLLLKEKIEQLAQASLHSFFQPFCAGCWPPCCNSPLICQIHMNTAGNAAVQTVQQRRMMAEQVTGVLQEKISKQGRAQ